MDHLQAKKRRLPMFVYSEVDDMDLSLFAIRVYMHLIRRADENGEAWPSYQNIGDHCFNSFSQNPTTRKSHARQAVDELIENGLITKRERRRGDNGDTSNVYTIQDIDNVRSTGEHPRANIAPPRANIAPFISIEGTPIEDNTLRITEVIRDEPSLATCSSPATSPVPDQKSIGQDACTDQAWQDSLFLEPEPSPTQALPPPSRRKSKHPPKVSPEENQARHALLIALAKCLNEDLRLNAAKLAKNAKDLYLADYTAEDVDNFRQWWDATDWRGKNGQPPSLGQLRAEIARSKQAIAHATTSYTPPQDEYVRVLVNPNEAFL